MTSSPYFTMAFEGVAPGGGPAPDAPELPALAEFWFACSVLHDLPFEELFWFPLGFCEGSMAVFGRTEFPGGGAGSESGIIWQLFYRFFTLFLFGLLLFYDFVTNF
jgi:hypothetical protein